MQLISLIFLGGDTYIRYGTSLTIATRGMHNNTLSEEEKKRRNRAFRRSRARDPSQLELYPEMQQCRPLLRITLFFF